MAPDAKSVAPRSRGSVTLVVLCLMSALSIGLASYLALTGSSSRLSNRRVEQETARQLAQVGLEEALWALNNNTWTASGATGNVAWTTSEPNRTVLLTYPLPGQSAPAQVAVTVANYASAGPQWPVITSTASLTLASGVTATITLQANTGPAPLFSNAIASADAYVSFAAGGLVDSWNSDPDNDPTTPALPYLFVDGDPANYMAVVAGRTDGAFGVVLTQATIRGYVSTFGAPVSFSASGSPPARVIGPTTPASVLVDTSRLGKSAFVPLAGVFAITPPPTNGANFGGLVNNAVELVDALLSTPGASVYKTSGNLDILGLPLIAPSVTIDRPIKLIVDGDLTIAEIGEITITPTGSLELFVYGDVVIGGNGMRNQTGEPRKLAVLCNNSSTTNALDYTTSQDFSGVIFCEYKPIDIRQNATFYGALLSRTYVRFSGAATSPVFHYDAALRNVRFSGVNTPYILKQVTEL